MKPKTRPFATSQLQNKQYCLSQGEKRHSDCSKKSNKADPMWPGGYKLRYMDSWRF